MTKRLHLIIGASILLSTSFTAFFATAEEIKTPSPTKGKLLFESMCAHCHTTTYDDSRIGAPGLQGVLERHDETWLNEWLKSPEAFAKIDGAAKDLISSNKFGLAMPTLPAMQDDVKRADIISYLKTLK